MRGEARTAEQGRARTALLVRAAAIAAWLATGLAALLGDLIHPSLRPDDDAAQTAVIVAMWLAYALVLAALLLPGPRALTVVRIGVPAGGLEAALAAADSSDLVAVIALFVGLVGTLVVLQPLYAEAHVNAASYGDERRFLLRPPGPVMIALIVPVWAIAVLGVAVGPLLLADRGWTAGIVAAAVGLPVAAFAAHALFRLNRRWLVFVPNGLVVHDHLAVNEPLPLSRRSVDSIGPARTGTGAADLTAQAFGMALELRLTGPVKAGVMTGRNRSEERSVTALLMSPSRPAAVLATAERRGLRIG
ncbi:MAG: hypothetical protein F4011_07985 [Acidimicrobiaceae bacterium]|nr:hypothetical protein [Acidimicrobiaceae bacterium]MYG98748.1 hypothetical protein [Acidimicrobiaceae bacterium]MYL04106.1 hypothetical protein [Acidimicrobiaceae bacterium]